jgi:ADP-ribose pyrophosphatase YjhB (NUDIX family)
MSDPAAGKFEFAGGHLENGENPRAAAVREWQEETGLPFPDGEWTGTWTSANGIYQGFVLTIPREADLDIFARQIGSDPDGDVDGSETIAWMDPAGLPANPMVRPELLADLPAVMAALGCTPGPACCGGDCCTGGCCGGTSGCRCGTLVDDSAPVVDEVAKAGGSAAPPKGDPDDWSGIWARTHERRTRLLAKHEKAVLAAWNDLTADLDPRALVLRFREDAGLVAKLASPDRPWWKDRGRDAALAWLYALQQRDGWPALVAAIEAAIAGGMAEGEADSLAVAADRQGVGGFPVAAAFTAAAQTLQGDPEVSQRAQDTAQAILAGAAAALAVTLADGAADDASDSEMAAAVSSTVTGPDVTPVRYALADALWAAAGDGLMRLIGKLMTGSPAPAGTVPGLAAPPSPPPQEPVPGLALISWVCEGGSPCPACLDNQGGSPYAPQDCPPLPYHPHCRCALYLASDVPASFFAAYLLAA